MVEIKTIDLHTFCDLYSVSNPDRFVLNKKFSSQKLTVEEWHKIVSADFKIKPLIINSPTSEVAPTAVTKPIENAKKPSKIPSKIQTTS